MTRIYRGQPFTDELNNAEIEAVSRNRNPSIFIFLQMI
ncbi:hypothetical protein RU86_GL001665 [Lactococcus piscium]|uniref:Uncharacterized protein n=1 Tax=Pseudolactococcus piscium TaxID=1364 RepID=A0A2A5S3N6_9LACT|nr:hypothetical protein RU86_GL001665 [Lactococcus piscium]